MLVLVYGRGEKKKEEGGGGGGVYKQKEKIVHTSYVYAEHINGALSPHSLAHNTSILL